MNDISLLPAAVFTTPSANMIAYFKDIGGPDGERFQSRLTLPHRCLYRPRIAAVITHPVEARDWLP